MSGNMLARFLVFALLVPTSAAIGESDGPAIFAHYYTWWLGNRPEYPLMPESGWYSHQLDPQGRPKPADLFFRHIAQARSAGLAGFSCEWPGRDSPESRLILNGLVAANNRLAPRARIRYLLCFDSTIWAMGYKKVIKAWYEPIPFTPPLAEDFAAEIGFVCNEMPTLDPNFRSNYLHLDGRPAVFVYNAHGFSGAWEQAVSLARETCEGSGGIYLIGDFEVSPHPSFNRKRTEEYPRKARHFDAVTNYTLFSGHTFTSLWEYISSGQLDAALQNGRNLGEASRSGQFYPGIIAQYFKTRKADAAAPKRPGVIKDRAFITDGSAGLVPIYKPDGSEDRQSLARNSRCTLQVLLRKTFRTKPDIVFITAWNEPYEGTMIEATRLPNPAGYIMHDDFLGLLAHLRNGLDSLADLDGNGRVDGDDEVVLRSCLGVGASARPSPSCMLADLDESGKVDESDLAALRAFRGRSPPGRRPD